MDLEHRAYQLRRVKRKEMVFTPTTPKSPSPEKSASSERWLKRFWRRHWKGVLTSVSLGVMLLIAVWLLVIVPVRSAYATATALRGKLEQMQLAAKGMQIDQIRVLLDESRIDIATMQSDVDGLRWMKSLPVAANNLVAVEEILTIADGLFLVVQDVINEFLPLIEQVAGATEGNIENSVQSDTKATELGAELLARLEGGEVAMANARREVELAEQRANRIETAGLIEPLQSTLSQLQSQLAEVDLMFGQFNDVFQILPILLGAESDQTYLLAIQNNTELRGTGGFFGNYGLVTIAGGKIGELEIADIYSIDMDVLAMKYGFAIPDPLGTYLSQRHLHLRDSNFWPDAPTSAERMLDMFTFETGITPSGVIFVDPTVIEDLIRILGPIEVPGYGLTVDQNNVTYQIQYQVHHNVASMDSRKDFVGIVGELLMARLFESSGEELKRVLASLQNNLTEKHLQLYSRDQKLQDFYCARSWCGAVGAAADDYLMINETNVGINKANFFVTRAMNYSVTVGNEDRAEAKLDVRYDNESPWGWPGGPYTTFLRIYVPLGSELMSSSGFVRDDIKTTVEYEGTPKAKTVFSGVARIEVLSTGNVSVSYRLPEGVAEGESYELTYQKQAGTPTVPGEKARRADPLVFQLLDPTGGNWVGVSGQSFEHQESGIRAQLEIVADTHIAVTSRNN